MALDVFLESNVLQNYLHPNCVLFDGEGDDGTSHLISISNCGLALHQYIDIIIYRYRYIYVDIDISIDI